MHVVTVLFQVMPQYAAQFRTAVMMQASASLARSVGCRRFDVSFSERDNQVFLYELYDTADDFQLHLKTSHFSRFSEQTKTWIISKVISEFSLASETEKHRGIGLVAHDACKQRLAEWVQRNEAAFGEYNLYATATTGEVIHRQVPSLNVFHLSSGPKGGDLQMGSLIVQGRVTKLIFFVDPLSPQPHDVDVKALTRIAILQNVGLAMNEETADKLL
jgi:methylglyoxal synthase